MSTFFDPATIRRLAAEGDKFFAGAAWILDQQDAARIDTTDYDSEWTRTPTSADCLREYEATTAGRLEHIQKRINALLDSPEVRGAIQQCAGTDADWEDYYRQMQARFER